MGSIQRLEITTTGHDPRADALADDLRATLRSPIFRVDDPATAVRGVRIIDLVFVEGKVTGTLRDRLGSLVADDILSTCTWNPGPPNAATYVESILRPGVTDARSLEVSRVLRRLAGNDRVGVASGRRIEIDGNLPDATVTQLTRRLLVNPVIEDWAIGGPITPTRLLAGEPPLPAPPPLWQERGATARVLIDGATSDDALLAINTERGLALDLAELHAIRDHVVARGVAPTEAELETIAQTWSEHCAHKTFRARITTDDGVVRPSLLGQLRASTERIASPWVVSAFVGNAGIVEFTPGTTVAIKCETHNHPSAVEPFGGANTGVGGVIRDILGASHRPIACTDILCFGPPDFDPASVPDGAIHPHQIRSGVVAGIADYGNKIGLPTVAGAVIYDAGYVANPLVYAGCIGVAPSPYIAEAPVPGDRIIVLGGRTGRDGLRGATFSSMTMDVTTGEIAGASVQIGDPIVEKALIDLLADRRDLYRSITDCGAGGLSSAIGELASESGARVDLDDLPLKYPGLAGWEIWLSEAQERMVVTVANSRPLIDACEAHGVEWTDVGEITGDGHLVVRHRSEAIVDLAVEFLHGGRPRREMRAVLPRPDRAPASAPEVSRHLDGVDHVATVLGLLSHPNIASKAHVIRRYDHEIRGATVIRPLVGARRDGHADGTVLAEPSEVHGLAIGVGVSPWQGVVDPERMGLSVVDEAIRNVVACGADPDRVVLMDNFSWGDPRRPETLGQLVAAVDGICTAAEAFGAPFISGKDSLNNEYAGPDGTRSAVPPTLVITAVAHVPDAGRTVTPDCKVPGNRLLTLGTAVATFGGSHVAQVHDVTGAGPVPAWDAASPERFRTLHRAIMDDLVVACHDISEGGLAVAVAEMAIGGDLGVDMSGWPTIAADDASLGTFLYAETPGRFVIEVAPEVVGAIRDRFGHDVTEVGVVTADQRLVLPDGSAIEMAALRDAWTRVP